MNAMFYGCSSLISLEDISKWETGKVTTMSIMFYGCSSLISLEGISKWEIRKNTDKNGMLSKFHRIINNSKKIKKIKRV